jgi:hypothetical protein
VDDAWNIFILTRQKPKASFIHEIGTFYEATASVISSALSYSIEMFLHSNEINFVFNRPFICNVINSIDSACLRDLARAVISNQSIDTTCCGIGPKTPGVFEPIDTVSTG